MLQIPDIDKEDIDNLLKPLGFHVCPPRPSLKAVSYDWSVIDKYGYEMWGTQRDDQIKCISSPSLKGLLKVIFEINDWEFSFPSVSFHNAPTKVNNPYFGCKSLEEALIKSDLI